MYIFVGNFEMRIAPVNKLRCFRVAMFDVTLMPCEILELQLDWIKIVKSILVFGFFLTKMYQGSRYSLLTDKN